MLVWQAGACPHGAPAHSDDALPGTCPWVVLLAWHLAALVFHIGLRPGSTLSVVLRTSRRRLLHGATPPGLPMFWTMVQCRGLLDASSTKEPRASVVGRSLLSWRFLANPFCKAQSFGLHFCTASPIKRLDTGALDPAGLFGLMPALPLLYSDS